MSFLILGGGLAGAVAAKKLADAGQSVTIVEAADAIGGKVRGYGCKAAEQCENCGVCLANGLWEDVEQNKSIRKMTRSRLIDLTGTKGDFTAAVKGEAGIETLTGLSAVVVATGFAEPSGIGLSGFAEIEKPAQVMRGSQLEHVLRDRGAGGLFAQPPKRVAFVQCYGSRDRKENASYCSKICCAYATRAAKVMKALDSDVDITFFYMDIQTVKGENYFDALQDLGIRFIKCRPIRITGGEAPEITYDDPASGHREKQAFDLIVLSDGIRAGDDAGRIAELCGLGQKKSGFLRYVTDASEAKRTGVYLIGCAKGPHKIEEVYQDAVTATEEILFHAAPPIL